LLSFVTVVFFMVRVGYLHAQPPTWRTTPCWLFILLIRSCPPYLEASPKSTTEDAMVTTDPHNIDRLPNIRFERTLQLRVSCSGDAGQRWHQTSRGIRFQLTIGNESLHKISNDNRVRVLNFANPKISVKNMFPHHNIHNYNSMSPPGKTHNQIGHIVRDRRKHCFAAVPNFIFCRPCTEHSISPCVAVTEVHRNVYNTL
jgi:hypothetical protein